jgi:hypothetical protein
MAARLRGRVLLANDEGYDEARRILNPTFDKRPALIVQPTGTADVRTAVEFAREHSLLLAVKCGGHSLSGAAGGAQEPVRSDESVPAQCECETDSELSDRPPSKPRRAGAIMFEDPLGGNRAAGTGRDGVPRVRQRGAGVRRVSVRRLRHVHLRDLLDARRHPVQGVPGEGRQRRTAPGQLIP